MLQQTRILQGVLSTVLIIYIGVVLFIQENKNEQLLPNQAVKQERLLDSFDEISIESSTNDYDHYLKIYSSQFKGQWSTSPMYITNNDPIKSEQVTQIVEEQLGFIRKQKGNILVRFNDLINSDNKMLYVYLYEDEFYDDQRKLLIKMPFEVNRVDLKQHQTMAVMTKFDKMHEIEKDEIEVIYTAYLYDRATQQQIKPLNIGSADLNQVNFYISIQTSSKNKLLSIQSDISIAADNQLIKNLNFCLFSSVIAIICLVGAKLLYNKLKHAENEAKNFSLLTLGFCTVSDAYLCLVYLWYALQMNKYFVIYIVPALFYFVLSTVFEMRLTVLSWKEKYYYRYSQQNQIKKGLAIFYTLFYIGLFGFFITMSFFYIYNEFLLSLSFIYVPQIINTAVNGNYKKFNASFIFVLILPRISLPLYIRGCPNNIINFKPSIYFCLLWVSSFLIQILIVYMQSKCGPRFFIPSIFLPKKHDYNFFYEFNTEGKEADDCAICLTALHLNPTDDETTQEQNNNENTIQPTPQLAKQLIKKKKISKTPCNHLFHIECLHTWTEVKLECPQCRQQLPAFI